MFGFPFEPYPIQRQLMEAIYNAIENRKIGIMESPTGTGKSLSVICAALSWLEDEERRCDEHLNAERAKLLSQLEELSCDEDWMSAACKKIEVERDIEELQKVELHKKKIVRRLDESRQRLRSKELEKSTHRFAALQTGKRKQKEDDYEAESEIFDESQKQEADLLPSDASETGENILFDENSAAEEDESLNCLKIIYASRTHSQLEQFAHELFKTKFRPRVLSVGGRQQLCINDSVRSLSSAALINDRCNQLLDGKAKQCGNKKPKSDKSSRGCPNARQNAIESLADEFLTDPNSAFASLQAMVDEGREISACPYLSARSSLSLCQLVLVPYNVWNLDLKNSVVIVDEAHNLLQTLASIHSCELSKVQVEQCCQLLQNYIDRFRERLSPKNLLHIRQLQVLIVSLNKLFSSFFFSQQQKQNQSAGQSSEERIFTLTEFIASLNCPSDINFFRVIEYIENAKLCRKLRNFSIRTPMLNLQNKESPASVKSPAYKSIDELIEKTKKPQKNKSKQQFVKYVPNFHQNLENSLTDSSTNIPSAPFYQLLEFLKALTSESVSDSRILLANTMQQPCFRFLHLNPIGKLTDLVSEARAVLLVGGTMRPTDLLIKGLTTTCNVPEERIIEFSCGHIVDQTNLLALSISHGPDKTELSLTYSTMQSSKLHTSIAQTIINLLRHIPNGVICFFPSYSSIDAFVKAIKQSGHIDSITKQKALFIETREGNGNKIWEGFCQSARNEKGAILMAVTNGRLSEGINFSDELGRCVFMIGMPYPNKNSMEITETIKFISNKLGKEAGHNYYENRCMQSVNQAIGRVIRHRNDYAAIVLLDSRYSRPSVEALLPGWIRDKLSHCSSFSESLGKMISFFKNKRPQT